MKIERGIPPPRRAGPGRPERFEWRKMRVGESFWVAAAMPWEKANLRHLAWSAGKRLGRRYVTAQENGGVRVWRVQ